MKTFSYNQRQKWMKIDKFDNFLDYSVYVVVRQMFVC